MIISHMTCLVVGYCIGMFVAYRINKRISDHFSTKREKETGELTALYEDTLNRLVEEMNKFIKERGGLKDEM